MRVFVGKNTHFPRMVAQRKEATFDLRLKSHWLSGWPQKSPNFFCTTKTVLPKSLRFMNSGTEKWSKPQHLKSKSTSQTKRQKSASRLSGGLWRCARGRLLGGHERGSRPLGSQPPIHSTHPRTWNLTGGFL